MCFLPALLALGVQQGAVQGPKGQQYMGLAEDLTYTCWKMYSLQPSGDCPYTALREACNVGFGLKVLCSASSKYAIFSTAFYG